MTRALVTQLFEALLQAVPPDQQEERFAGMQAITAACEYLATEPIGERAEFEAWCKTVGHSTSPDHVDKQRYWYAETSAAWDAWQASRKAKQALESDSEYLATEPSGERAELIANLNRIADEGWQTTQTPATQIVVQYGNPPTCWKPTHRQSLLSENVRS